MKLEKASTLSIVLDKHGRRPTISEQSIPQHEQAGESFVGCARCEVRWWRFRGLSLRKPTESETSSTFINTYEHHGNLRSLGL
jgi:hypothetical protein